MAGSAVAISSAVTQWTVKQTDGQAEEPARMWADRGTDEPLQNQQAGNKLGIVFSID